MDNFGHLTRTPQHREDNRNIGETYFWTPNSYPFHILKKQVNTTKNKKKKKENPYMQVKHNAIKLGLDDLNFKNTIAGELGTISTNITSASFKDDKENTWFFALNANILSLEQLNTRLKNNFELNIAKNHTKEQLLSAVYTSEFFTVFSNKLWELNMENEDKIIKLAEIFIFTMTYLNFGDYLHDQIFRMSLGIEEPELENELNNLPVEAWENTIMNKSLYFDLCSKSNEELENLKSNLNLYNYSREALQYLSIFHNDNCIYRAGDGNAEYLNTLGHNKIIQQGELEGAPITNRIQTANFKCLVLKLDQTSKKSLRNNRKRKQ